MITVHRNQIKSIVGWIIVLGHFLVGFVVLIGKDAVLDADQKISVLLVLAPVFSIYFVSVVRGFIASAEDMTSGPIVNLNFAAIALLLPLAQFFAVLYLTISYPSSIVPNIDDLQKWLSALEVFLGGTVGLVVDNLFPKTK
jgi:hypothetical protein